MTPVKMRLYVPAVLLLLLLGETSALPAGPDLMVYPTRVVMSDKVRTAQVDIINTSQEQASYKISLARKQMTETGEFREAVAEDQEEKFADDLVKFSPRQVTLLPGAGQTVRIMFKAPADLGDGEYRSHLVFGKVPAAIGQVSDAKEQENKEISMKVTANIGVSIPIIVRHGQLKAEAAIDPSTVTLAGTDPKQQKIALTLSRTGTRSIYGDLTIYRGKEKIASSDGLAVYTPNSKRKIVVRVLDEYRLQSGDAIQVVFTEKGESRPLAQASVVLP